MLIISPPRRWSRTIVRRWTIALPMPSIGSTTASSWTITTMAKIPNSAGGISRARTTIEPSRTSSIATRE